MARYGTFTYSTTDSATETTYGVSFGTENSILYGLTVDWDGDGSYDQFNEASRVLAWSVDRGRDSIINPSGNGFTPYNVGRLILTLDNHDGRYDSWNTSSELYGNLMPGKKMQFRCRVCEYVNEIDLDATTDSLYIYGTSTDYDTARGTATGAIYTGNYVGQTYSTGFGVHSVRRSFLKFDTSYIGENINLSKVNLKITPTAVNNDADYNVLIKQHDWSEELTVSEDSAYDGCLASTDSYIFGNSANLSAGSVHSSSDLPTNWINKTTPTYYSLISSRDQAGDHYSVESADFDEYITFDQTSPVLHLEYQNINDYFIFTGIVTDIQLDGYRRTATMICEDGWRFLADNPYSTAGEVAFSGIWWSLYKLIYSGRYEDVSLYPWRATYGTKGFIPELGSINTEDSAYRWVFDGTRKSGVEEVMHGSLSRVWIDTESYINYYSYKTTTDEAVYNLDEDMILDNIYLPNVWENYRSKVALKGVNRYVVTDNYFGNYIKFDRPIAVAAGESVDHYFKYTTTDFDSNFGVLDARITNYTANTGSTDGGTDLKDDFEVRGFDQINNFKITVINHSASDGYLTSMTVGGDPYQDEEFIKTYESEDVIMNSEFALDNSWLSITYKIEGGEVLNMTTDADSYDTDDNITYIDGIGNTLASYLGTIRPYPVIQLRGRHEIQMLFDLEDKVNLNLPTYGIHEDFRIHKISHQTIGGLQDILTTLWLYPVITPV